MLGSLMKTSTPRAGDEENHFPAHYSEADQMARFSSTGGCRYNNGSDRITLLAMHIMILHNLYPGHHRPMLHLPGALSRVSPSFGLHVLIPRGWIFCWYRLVVVSPLLRAEVVGECLARCTPRGLQKIQWSGA